MASARSFPSRGVLRDRRGPGRRARIVLIPILDILQSVPILGFLAITVTFFIAPFPGSELGLECAAIFAIFTSMAWNMTFSMYHSLITQPVELDEAARMFRLTKWERFWRLDVPSSMIGLVWNGIVVELRGRLVLPGRFGGDERRGNKTYTLPGIGSYVAAAVDKGERHRRRSGIAIAVMVHPGGGRELRVLGGRVGGLRREVPGGDVGVGRNSPRATY